jgi:hypothetical protein
MERQEAQDAWRDLSHANEPSSEGCDEALAVPHRSANEPFLPSYRSTSSWDGEALCRKLGIPTEWYFPKRGWTFRPVEAEQTRQAKAACEACPVRTQCLEAVDTDDEGIWGGLGAGERKAMRARRLQSPDDRSDAPAA